jgi:hypothetical protein
LNYPEISDLFSFHSGDFAMFFYVLNDGKVGQLGIEKKG